MVVGLESWGGGPLALLLEVSKVEVFSPVGGNWCGCFEGEDQLVICFLAHHFKQVGRVLGLRFPVYGRGVMRPAW